MINKVDTSNSVNSVNSQNHITERTSDSATPPLPSPLNAETLIFRTLMLQNPKYRRRSRSLDYGMDHVDIWMDVNDTSQEKAVGFSFNETESSSEASSALKDNGCLVGQDVESGLLSVNEPIMTCKTVGSLEGGIPSSIHYDVQLKDLECGEIERDERNDAKNCFDCMRQPKCHEFNGSKYILSKTTLDDSGICEKNSDDSEISPTIETLVSPRIVSKKRSRRSKSVHSKENTDSDMYFTKVSLPSHKIIVSDKFKPFSCNNNSQNSTHKAAVSDTKTQLLASKEGMTYSDDVKSITPLIVRRNIQPFSVKSNQKQFISDVIESCKNTNKLNKIDQSSGNKIALKKSISVPITVDHNFTSFSHEKKIYEKSDNLRREFAPKDNIVDITVVKSLVKEEPKLDMPKLDTPKSDTPELDMTKLDTCKLDMRKLDSPKLDIPKLDTPKLDMPKLDTHTGKLNTPIMLTIKDENYGSNTWPGKVDSGALCLVKGDNISEQERYKTYPLTVTSPISPTLLDAMHKRYWHKTKELSDGKVLHHMQKSDRLYDLQSRAFISTFESSKSLSNKQELVSNKHESVSNHVSSKNAPVSTKNASNTSKDTIVSSNNATVLSKTKNVSSNNATILPRTAPILSNNTDDAVCTVVTTSSNSSATSTTLSKFSTYGTSKNISKLSSNTPVTSKSISSEPTNNTSIDSNTISSKLSTLLTSELTYNTPLTSKPSSKIVRGNLTVPRDKSQKSVKQKRNLSIMIGGRGGHSKGLTKVQPAPNSRLKIPAEEVEVAEACRWLQATGFPQYLQMYKDGLFPIDLDDLKTDNHYLEYDSLQALARRLEVLNRCSQLKIDVSSHKLLHEDSDAETERALNEKWQYERHNSRWVHKGHNPPNLSDSFDNAQSDSESPGLKQKNNKNKESFSPRLRRAASLRVKSARNLLRRVDILNRSQRRKRSVGDIGAPVIIDSDKMDARIAYLNCQAIKTPDFPEKMNISVDTSPAEIEPWSDSDTSHSNPSPVFLPDSPLIGDKSEHSTSEKDESHTTHDYLNDYDQVVSSAGYTVIQNRQSRNGNRERSSDDSSYIVPFDHIPGTFPKVLSNGYVETDNRSGINIRTGSFNFGLDSVHSSPKDCRRRLQTNLKTADSSSNTSIRRSIYDNVPDSDLLSLELERIISANNINCTENVNSTENINRVGNNNCDISDISFDMGNATCDLNSRTIDLENTNSETQSGNRSLDGSSSQNENPSHDNSVTQDEKLFDNSLIQTETVPFENSLTQTNALPFENSLIQTGIQSFDECLSQSATRTFDESLSPQQQLDLVLSELFENIEGLDQVLNDFTEIDQKSERGSTTEDALNISVKDEGWSGHGTSTDDNLGVTDNNDNPLSERLDTSEEGTMCQNRITAVNRHIYGGRRSVRPDVVLDNGQPSPDVILDNSLPLKHGCRKTSLNNNSQHSYAQNVSQNNNVTKQLNTDITTHNHRRTSSMSGLIEFTSLQNGRRTPTIQNGHCDTGENKCDMKSYERRDSGVGSSLTRNTNSQKQHRVRWHSFQRSHRPSITNRSHPIDNLSVGQFLLLKKLALLKLTAIMESSSPSRSAWSWVMPRFMKRGKTPEYTGKNVFGVPLTVTLQRTGQPLPQCVLAFMRYLRRTSRDSVGLFRKSGVKSRIMKLRADVEANPDMVDAESIAEDIQAYDIADLLKQYFRDLPECLLTNKLSQTFLNIHTDVPPTHRLDALHSAILLLPDENREVLQSLLLFLSDVAKDADQHQMTSSNLAVCFAPSLFHTAAPKASTPTSSPKRPHKSLALPDVRELVDQKAAHECLCFMISECHRLFSLPEETITKCRFSYIEQGDPVTLEEMCNSCRDNKPGYLTYIDTCIHGLIKESHDKFKGWLNAPSVSRVDVSYKKVSDGHPLRLWRCVTEVDASPVDVTHRILHERHLWDEDMIEWRKIEKISRNTDVFQYTVTSMAPHPSRDYCVLRSWKTDLANGICVVIATSVDHPDSALIGGIRSVLLASRYLIEPVGNGHRSKVTHIVREDIRGHSQDWYNRSYGHLAANLIAGLRASLKIEMVGKVPVKRAVSK